MATKPTLNLPEWASSEAIGTNVIEPVARKTTGYTATSGVPEKPTYQEMNFLFKSIYEWLEYFETLTDESLENEKSIALNVETGFVYLSGAGNFECSESSIPAQSIDVDDRNSKFYGSDNFTFVSENSSVVTVSLTSSDASNPRWDLVELDASAGTYSVVDGTASANPTYPSGTAGKDAIAYVYRKASTAGNTIYDRDILDARVSIKNKNVDGHFKTNFSINQKEDMETSYYDNQQMFQQVPFNTKFDYVQENKTNLQYIDTILVPADSVNGEVVYSGTWTNSDDSNYFFGRAKRSSTANSTAIFSFSGVSVNLICLKDQSITAFISVELSDDDGTTYHSKKTFNTGMSGDYNYNNVYELYQGLDYGDYKVKVTILAGTGNVSIEGFSYATYLIQTPITQKALLSQSPTDIDDVPPLTTLVGGTWDGLELNASMWNGSRYYTENNSATVEYKFYGSSIYVNAYISFLSYDAGFSVTIDGAATYVKNSSISLPNYAGNHPVWIRLDNGSLPEGVHTVKITTTSVSASEQLAITGWAHYSSKYPTTCSRSLICGKNSYAVGIDNPDITLNGSFTKIDNPNSFLGRRADTSTAGDNLTITTPTNCKAIYLITYDETDQGEVKITLGGSNTRYINIDTADIHQGSNIKLLYDAYIDGVSLDSLTLQIEKNVSTGGTNMRIDGVIFEIGDAVDSDAIFCMPKWTRYNSSSSYRSPVSTSHRLDVYGSKSDGSSGRQPMVHSGFVYHTGGSYVHYRHGLNMQDMNYKYERGYAVPKVYYLDADEHNDLYNFYGDFGLISTSNYAANEWIRISLFPNRVI